MKEYYAIAVYQCSVGGEPTDAYDVSVHYFRAESEDEVHAQLAEPRAYESKEGEEFVWHLVRVMAVDEFQGAESGDEVTGFILRGDFGAML